MVTAIYFDLTPRLAPLASRGEQGLKDNQRMRVVNMFLSKNVEHAYKVLISKYTTRNRFVSCRLCFEAKFLCCTLDDVSRTTSPNNPRLSFHESLSTLLLKKRCRAIQRTKCLFRTRYRPTNNALATPNHKRPSEDATSTLQRQHWMISQPTYLHDQ